MINQDRGPRQNGVDFEDLNKLHKSSIDKWYRMRAGSGWKSWIAIFPR
jgi:hypothetical protein